MKKPHQFSCHVSPLSRLQPCLQVAHSRLCKYRLSVESLEVPGPSEMSSIPTPPHRWIPLISMLSDRRLTLFDRAVIFIF